MCSILTLNLSRSAGKALLGKGSFGWFDKEVTFEVRVGWEEGWGGCVSSDVCHVTNHCPFGWFDKEPTFGCAGQGHTAFNSNVWGVS